jgi:hypothetical protein
VTRTSPIFVVDERWRCARVLEQGERRFEDCVLALGIPGAVQRVAVRKRDVQGPRRSNFLGDDSKQADDDGRDPSALELRCDQTHGLIADRSDGNEKRHVHTVFFEQARGLGNDVASEPAGSGDRAHEGQMAMVQRADATTVHELSKSVEREREIRVFRQTLMIERLTSVVLAELGDVDVAGDNPIGGIAAPHRVAERLVTGTDEARGRDESELALGERPGESSPRHRVDAAPLVGLDEQANGERKLADVTHGLLF